MKSAALGVFAACLSACALAVSPASAEPSPAPAPAQAPKLLSALPEAPAPKPASEAAPAQPAPAANTPAAAPAPAPAGEPAAAADAAAKPAPPKPPAITLAIDIDLTRQHMTIKEHGKVVGSWPISSGTEGYRTPTGTFRPLWQSRMWYSKKYDNAPMPHAVFFNGGVAMHATQSTGMLGRPASHGCIRQSPANAAKTYALVSKHGFAHTRIVVRGVPRDEPAVARRQRGEDATRYAGRYRDGYETAPGTRRVIIVDAYGNRRVAVISAADPRLANYYRRPYQGGYGYGYAGGYYGSGYADW